MYSQSNAYSAHSLPSTESTILFFPSAEALIFSNDELKSDSEFLIGSEPTLASSTSEANDERVCEREKGERRLGWS